MGRPTKYNLVSEDYYLQFCHQLKLLYDYNLITKLTKLLTVLLIVLLLSVLTDGCVHLKIIIVFASLNLLRKALYF